MVKRGCRADRCVGWYLTAQDGGHGCRGSAVATWETTAEGHRGQIREEMNRVRGEALPNAACTTGAAPKSISPTTRNTTIAPAAQSVDWVAQENKYQATAPLLTPAVTAR